MRRKVIGRDTILGKTLKEIPCTMKMIKSEESSEIIKRTMHWILLSFFKLVYQGVDEYIEKYSLNQIFTWFKVMLVISNKITIKWQNDICKSQFALKEKLNF